MTNPMIQINNIETGEVIEREMNAEELAVVAEVNEYQKDLLAKQLAEKAKRQSALAKLEALGLDEDDLKALGL